MGQCDVVSAARLPRLNLSPSCRMLHARADRLLPPPNAEALEAAITCSRLHCLKTGHMMPSEAAPAVAEEVLRLLGAPGQRRASSRVT